ncbi:hypothetical protein R69776_06958 [Paraburkholderia nemoris]|uniref:Uncharacterized protein n=1 Tax=Paraburkholderia nemoris TaxID=2793076 RepID=A0ABM8SX32_9BURK|nr:hypothetical protein R75777_01232 [Paraburkholderia nemoris]CAE6839221.1 hypothetical protein R69776_06958 [Paraburkholderia nemoris]
MASRRGQLSAWWTGTHPRRRLNISRETRRNSSERLWPISLLCTKRGELSEKVPVGWAPGLRLLRFARACRAIEQIVAEHLWKW